MNNRVDVCKCFSVYITVMAIVLHMFCSSRTVWSSNITRDFIRRGWKKVTMVVTPAVVVSGDQPYNSLNFISTYDILSRPVIFMLNIFL